MPDPVSSRWSSRQAPTQQGGAARKSARISRRRRPTLVAAVTGLVTAPLLGLPLLAGPASAAVTIGEITVFPNRDMVVAVGYNPGEDLTIEVLRNDVVIGTTSGKALSTPEGDGLEVNHGVEGAGAPGECWTDYTPDIIGGDVIRVTSPRGVDTMTVADVDFRGDPFLDGDNISIPGVGQTAASPPLVEFRRDKPAPRFRRDEVPVQYTPGTNEWTATFTPESPTSTEGLTPAQQRDILLNEASWMAVVTAGTPRPGAETGPETTIAEHGEPGGVAAGCTGSADPNSIGGGFTNPVNITSGDITLSGTAREGVTDVSLTIGTLAPRSATLSANATGAKTWSLPVRKADLLALPDGNITITPTFTTTTDTGTTSVVGGSRTLLKDTVAPGAPTATPAPGSYPATQHVALNKPAGEASSKVHWNIGNGSQAAPDATDTVYSTQIAVSASQTIKARVIDAAGNPGPVATLAYRIGATGDTTRPTVRTRTPGVNALSVAVGANATATFSEAVRGVSGSTVTLKNAATGAAVPAVVSYNTTTRVATLNPSANLAADTRYTVTLTGGITDAAGNALAQTSWTFTTGPAPRVSTRAPAVNATGVGRTANVTATMSEPVTGVSTTTVRLRNAATGAGVTAVVSYNATSRVITLNPSVTLAANTRYTATLTNGIKDRAGNPLPNTTWTFTTGAR